MESNVLIELEAFDREYGLADLLQLQEHHERLLGLVTEARAAIGDSGSTDGRELSRQAAEIVRLRESLISTS